LPSEAIARITGVQMTRYFDEANGVLIRGLPNVQTTVQGREIFTAEGRLVAIPDFPAQALSPVEVLQGDGLRQSRRGNRRPDLRWPAPSVLL